MQSRVPCLVLLSLLGGCSEEARPAPGAPDSADTSPAESDADAQRDSDIDSTLSGDVADALEDSGDADDATADADTALTDSADTAVADVTDADSDAAPPPARELWVVRVGDDSVTLTAAAAPVFVDRLALPAGTPITSIALPIAPSGADRAITLSGTGFTEGALTRSADGRFVTMAGYAAPPGTADVSFSSTMDALRVVARIDATGAVSTATTTTAYDGSIVRSVVTDNGARFWLAGSGGGISYLAGFGGAVTATFVSTGAINVRSATIIGGALYGAKGSGSTILFDFAGGLPTSASTPTALPGGPTSGAPLGMIGFARTGTETDLLYVCDERAASVGGGIQRWTKASGSWSLSSNLSPSSTTGCRAITGSFVGGRATLYVVTAELPTTLVSLTDDLSTTAPIPTVLATSTPKKPFRGVALQPGS
jgi:hypothetical protein